MYYAKPSDNCTYYVTQNNLCCGILHASVHHYVHRRSMVQYTGTVGTLNSANCQSSSRTPRSAWSITYGSNSAGKPVSVTHLTAVVNDTRWRCHRLNSTDKYIMSLPSHSQHYSSVAVTQTHQTTSINQSINQWFYWHCSLHARLVTINITLT